MKRNKGRNIERSYDLLSGFDFYYPDGKGVIILLALLIAGSIIGNLVTLALTLLPGAESLSAYSMLIAYPIMFIPAMMYASSRSRFNSGFGTGNPVPVNRSDFGKLKGWMLAAMAAVTTLAANTVTDPVMKLLPETPEWFERVMEQMLTGTPLWATLVSVSVFAPFFEEWLCRGMVLRGLLRKMKPAWAMVISSLFFAVIHMNPWQALPAFILGMLFAYVYYRTGSLWMTMLMHCTNNTFAAIVGQNENLRNASSISELIPMWQYIVLIAASLAVIVLFIDILRRNTAVPSKENSGSGE